MKNNILLILVIVFPLVLFFAFDTNAFSYSDSEYKGRQPLIDKKHSRIVGQNLGWLESCGRGGRARDLKDEIKFLSYADFRQINLGYAVFQSGGTYAIGCDNDYQVISETKDYIQNLKNRVNAKNKTTTSSSTTSDNKLKYCKTKNGSTYSTYKKCGYKEEITKKEYDRLNSLSSTQNQNNKNEFGGIGIEISMEDGVVKVIAPFKNSPAYKAGIKAGDLILRINDKTVYGLSLDEAASMIRGKIGTRVKLNIKRNNKYLEINLSREKINTETMMKDEKKLYCKRYDGKVFERKKSCDAMDEITFVEFVESEIANGVPGYYCQRPNGTVYTTSYKYNCITNKEISHEKYISIIKPKKSAKKELTKFDTKAEQAIVIDYETGKILFEKNSSQKIAPASMTKIMTVYAAFDRIINSSRSIEDRCTVSSKAYRMGGSRMFLEINKKVTINDLLKGIIIQSGNDASVALAECLSGTEEQFSKLMNTYAKNLGLNDTHFTNASGWPDKNHYSTVKDIAILSKELIRKFPNFYIYFNFKDFTYNGIKQENRNQLLEKTNGVDGIKTGYVKSAGWGIASSAIRNNKRIIAVLSGANSSRSRINETTNLINWAFTQEISEISKLKEENIVYCKQYDGKVFKRDNSCGSMQEISDVEFVAREIANEKIEEKNNVNSLKFLKGYEDGIFSLNKEYLPLLQKLSSAQIKNRLSGTSAFGSIARSNKTIQRYHQFFSSDGKWFFFTIDENKNNFSHTINSELTVQGEWYIKDNGLCTNSKNFEEGCLSLYQFRNNEKNKALYYAWEGEKYNNEIYMVTSHIEKTKKLNFNQARTIVLNKLEKEKENYLKALRITDLQEVREKYFTKPYVHPFNVIHLAKNNYGKDDILTSFAGHSLNKVKNESLVKCLNEKSKRSIESQCELLFINFDIFKDANEDENIEYWTDDDYIQYAGIFYTIKNANIRSAPNLKETTEILFTVPKGEVVEVLAKAADDPDWVQVRYLGTYGYMYFPLLSKDQVLLKDLPSEVTQVDDKSPATADENPGTVVDLSNVIRKRLIDLNELFELELITQDEYEQRKFLLLDQVDSGSFLMDLLTEKLITREEFDTRFNELLLNAKGTLENEDKEFPIADLLKDLRDTNKDEEVRKEEDRKSEEKRKEAERIATEKKKESDRKADEQKLKKEKEFKIPVSIAVTSFFSKDPKNQTVGKNISLVIQDNLERSGLFLPIDPKTFIQDNQSLSKQPRFEDWKIIKAQHLISGEISKKDGKISAEFRLYDVFSQKQLIAKKYETSEKNWRRVSHIISDAIFERITGEGGYFDTRIVYVAETGPKENRQKRLAIMDQDQANHLFLTDGSYLVASPIFSPNSQKIAYMSYINKNNPRVYIFDIETGQQELVGEFPGMTFAPRFSPDGKKIIMSYADPDVGNSEIYILDLATRASSRITNSSAIDVSASFSPDGKKVVFNSDRSGRRHLYVAKSDGKNVKKISREGGSYYTPVWSPRGDYIAFTKHEGGQFYIGVMETDGSNERMIAKSFHVEGPTWAPNGKYLFYYKLERTAEDGSGGESSLYSIDLTGYNERKVITPLGGSQPDWSPLMH